MNKTIQFAVGMLMLLVTTWAAAVTGNFAPTGAMGANSGSNWTRIPRQTGQPFQSKLDTDSTANWTVK